MEKMHSAKAVYLSLVSIPPSQLPIRRVGISDRRVLVELATSFVIKSNNVDALPACDRYTLVEIVDHDDNALSFTLSGPIVGWDTIIGRKWAVLSQYSVERLDAELEQDAATNALE